MRHRAMNASHAHLQILSASRHIRVAAAVAAATAGGSQLWQRSRTPYMSLTRPLLTTQHEFLYWVGALVTAYVAPITRGQSMPSLTSKSPRTG